MAPHQGRRTVLAWGIGWEQQRGDAAKLPLERGMGGMAGARPGCANMYPRSNHPRGETAPPLCGRPQTGAGRRASAPTPSSVGIGWRG